MQNNVHMKLKIFLRCTPFISHLALKRTTGIRYISLSGQTHSTQVNKINADERIVKSPYPNFNAVNGITIPELVWTNLSGHENTPALECSVTGRTLTHGDVFKQSRSFAAALIASGVKRKDVICILLPNCPDYSTALFGIWEAGAIACPINPTYTKDELAALLKLSRSKVIITSAGFLPSAIQAQQLLPNINSIIVTGPPRDGCHTFDEMVKVDSKGTNFLKGSEVDTTNEVAALPFSSGTTGLPKGVQLTHSNLCSNLMQFGSPDVTAWRKQEAGQEQLRTIAILPFFHAAGLTHVLANHFLGCNTLCFPQFIPTMFTQAIKRFKPHLMPMVPAIASFVSSTPDITTEDLQSLECVQVGAAPCGTALIEKLHAKVGRPIFFQEVYGLTELSPFCTVMNPSKGNTKLGSCGTLVPGTTAKVIDIDTGKSLGPQENGELCIKGPQVMKGYLDNEEATAKTIDAYGWLHTGDIGYYDDDGCFYIIDRLKELIKVNGLQVAPAELEGEIRKHPDVLEVAVIGVPDERAGELPRAYIVSKTKSLTESEVNQFLDGKISKYKQLKGGIEFVDALPKSAVGKILRKDLREKYILSSKN